MRVHVPIRLAVVVALLGAGLAWPADASTPRALEIRTLSNRADLVSGGDVLVQVDLPAGSRGARVTVDGRDVSKAFASRGKGRYQGMVTGLRLGANTVVARAGGQTARLVVTSSPLAGPVFSGPQITPWYCLPGALDAQCRRPVTVTYQYKSSVTGGFAAYDPASPPADVATTTTDEGRTVPYVVRVESGTMDRSQYAVAVLHDGAAPFDRWSGPPAWNGKAYVTHGGGCAGFRTEGLAPPVVNDQALSRGWLVMSAALEDSIQNCNLVVQAESVMMLKEHVVERYGDIRYVLGMGSSGGSLASLQIANAYPGLYDGLTVGATFPDLTLNDLLDCRALHDYFDAPQTWAPGVVWTEPAIAAASGKQSSSVCRLQALPFGPENFSNMFNPSDPAWCGMSSHEPERVYHPTSNPTGVRCAIQDYMVNVLGRRPAADRGPVEEAARTAFAGRPYDNVGVPYGLRALRAGQITPAQFVDLNAKTGSRDIDYVAQPTRVAADRTAVARAYRSGMVNAANHLDRIPIIDVPNPYGNADIHDKYKSFALRARLDAANGHHDNHLVWYGPDRQGMAGNADDGAAFQLMDEWLTAIERDRRDVPLEQKVRDSRPERAKDRCDLPEPGLCTQLFGPAGSTRWGAGAPLASDVMVCRLKPLARKDFTPVVFTDAEWAALAKAFPTGVCDWSKPGVLQRQTVAWQTYQRGPGGQPLGAPPRSTLVR